MPKKNLKSDVLTRSIVTLAFLVIFYPIGAILASTWMKEWPRWLRIALLVPLGLALAIGLLVLIDSPQIQQ